MTEFVYFLGRFHVLVVHLPIGILLLAAFLEALHRHPRFRAIEPAVTLVWLVGAFAALAAVVFGYMHASEGGFEPGAINRHRWSATALTVVAFAAWACRAEAPRAYARAWLAAPVVTLALLILTGHYGGNLTHGATYLAEYAPGPLRTLMGAPAEIAPRPPVTSLAEADVYLDIVAPALRRRCGSCHNESRRRGELVLVSHEGILAGGESGPVIVAGDADASELVRRISLPPDDVDFMPKNDKPPLSEDEADAVAWWIDIGAPSEGTVDGFAPSPRVSAALSRALGLDATAASGVQDGFGSTAGVE